MKRRKQIEQVSALATVVEHRLMTFSKHSNVHLTQRRVQHDCFVAMLVLELERCPMKFRRWFHANDMLRHCAICRRRDLRRSNKACVSTDPLESRTAKAYFPIAAVSYTLCCRSCKHRGNCHQMQGQAKASPNHMH